MVGPDADETVSLAESMEMTSRAAEKYDVCPECGQEYVGLDTTRTGNLVFVHRENPLKTCTMSGG